MEVLPQAPAELLEGKLRRLGEGIGKVRGWVAPAPRDWTLNSADEHAMHRRQAQAQAVTTSLRLDDVIAGVNRNPVESVAALTAALNNAKPPIALQVQREGRSLFLLVR